MLNIISKLLFGSIIFQAQKPLIGCTVRIEDSQKVRQTLVRYARLQAKWFLFVHYTLYFSIPISGRVIMSLPHTE